MRRTVVLALALVAGGCGEAAVEQQRTTPSAAGPQQASLGWRETYPDRTSDRLVFEVESFEVTRRGWTADVAITNETRIPFEANPRVVESRYGLILFATGDLSEIEDVGVPPPRLAERIEPAPPAVLGPGATWRGRLSAQGALAAGSYVRIVFGPLVAEDEPPEGMQESVTWITDRSYRLRP